MRGPFAVPILALLVPLAACWDPGSGSPSRSRPTPRTSTGVITPTELRDTGASDLYQAIQRLRPQWLVVRGRGSRGARGSPERLVIYLDGTRYGAVGSLRQISPSAVAEIRYYSSSEATTRFGTGHTAGAIVVTTNANPETGRLGSGRAIGRHA